MNEEEGITIVLVTHDANVAQHAKRVIVFKDGKIRKDSQVENPRDASEEVRNLPPPIEDDDDED